MPEVDQVVELELTFLAKKLPEAIQGVKPNRIIDIYIPEAAANPYLRLRQKGDKYEITHKQPVDPSDVSYQTEQTITLTKDEFQALAAASTRRIEKDRYEVDIDGNPAEMDVFLGDLQGLVIIDFEFDTVAAKQNFRPPSVCLAEVTQEKFIAGGQLTGKTYADIAPELTRYNYLKIMPGV